MYKFLVILTCFSSIKSQNFFLVKKDSESDYYCITNSSFGLSWIYEDNIDNIIPQKGSTFIPDLHSDVKWNLKKYPTLKPWSLEKSLNGQVNEVILDRRWENMQVIQTQPLPKDFSNHANLTVVVSNEKDDLVVPFSICSNAADIFFILAVDVTKRGPKMYWLNLQVGNELQATFRTCVSLDVASNSCDNSKNKLSPKLLPSKWLHLEIRKSNNLLTVTHINGSDHKEIVTHNDSNVSLITEIIIGRFQNKSIPYKNHSLEYMYTTERMKYKQFGPAIDVRNRTICISMFVSMCQSCTLKLALLNKNQSLSSILNETKYNYQKSGWSEIQYYLEDIKNEQVYLTISTTITNYSDESFWAIDQIRQCQQNEQRMIMSSKKGKCQLISDDNGIISIEDLRNDEIGPTEELRNNGNKCSENKIGSFCTPYSWIFSDTCSRLKICENYETINKCYYSECKFETVNYFTSTPPPHVNSVVAALNHPFLITIIIIFNAIVIICFIVYAVFKLYCNICKSNRPNMGEIGMEMGPL